MKSSRKLTVKKYKDDQKVKNTSSQTQIVQELKIEDVELPDEQVKKTQIDDFLENVKIIQFECGGTFLDNNQKLINVINYLQDKGFYNFSYLTSDGTKIITNFNDHYQYCNIVCINKNSNFVPF